MRGVDPVGSAITWGDVMKVSDLAAELEVPSSTVLDQCQRFGISATWAGAELTGADVVVLRSELAGGEPIDLTPADPSPAALPASEPATESAPVADGDADPVTEPEVEPVPAIEPGPAIEPEPAATAPSPRAQPAPAGGALPPTAVGSLPHLIDEVTPEVEEEPPSRAPGFLLAGGGDGDSVDREATRRIPPREPPATRRLDRAARNSLLALLIAAIAFAASNFVDLAAAIAVVWLICAAALVGAIVNGIRGRRHVQVHPERVTGLWLSMISLVLAIGGVIGLALSVGAVVGDSPADDAPMGIGELSSVQEARWGYQRVTRIANSGWRSPARDEGSCWDTGRRELRKDVDQRVEIEFATDNVNCDANHTMEAAIVFAVNRNADEPYPGMSGIVEAAQKVCGPTVAKHEADGVTVELKAEYPTEQGWGDGDRDVVCMLVTPTRDGALGS